MKKISVFNKKPTAIKRKIAVPIAGLKIGMEIVELDRPWLETPFILQNIIIRSVEDIIEVSKYCEYVYIETTNTQWLDHKSRDIKKSDHNYTSKLTSDCTVEFNNATSLHTDAKQLTRSFMDDVRLGRAIDVKQVKNTVSACVQSILRSPEALLWMSKLRKKDKHEASHALDVSLLAISFGRYLGVSEGDLHNLGIAGLLHDVGKMRIPNSILQKNSPLNEQELTELKQHPLFSRQILMSHPDLYHGAVDVAYTHHETLDGTGYPRKLKASGIRDITRIIAICDTYNDITSDQSYKKGKSSLQAMKAIYMQRGTKFDELLVQEFIACIGLYPSGSIVELHSGEVGIIISTNYQHRHLPKVLVLLCRNKSQRPEKVVDLAKSAESSKRNDFIKNLLPNGAFGIRVESYVNNGLVLN